MFPEGRLLDFVIVGVVALIVVGPKDLPGLMRKVGQFMARVRGMAAEFRASFDELARQSELDELRKEIETLRSHQTITGLESDLNAPLETAAVMAEPDIGPEPRSGEFKVTDTAPVAADSPQP